MFKISEEMIPPPLHGRGRKSVYPFDAMRIGQHFDAPRDMGRHNGDARRRAICMAARSYAKRHNPTAKFTTQIIDEHTVRCWRIA